MNAPDTILVIDDEPAIRAITREYLSQAGLRVASACDGAEGLEVFRREPGRFFAVLLDVTMPGLPAADVVRDLRGLRPDVHVLLVTGLSEEDARARVGGARVDGFVLKPFRYRELADRLRALCR